MRSQETVPLPERRVEIPVTPETARESAPQERVSEPEKEGTYAAMTAPTPVQRQAGVQPMTASQAELKQIESILEERIANLYVMLPDDIKPAFRKKGEEVARQIQSLLSTAKLKVKQILSLIASWLAMIPGVNKFYIEQEAEMKTQKLLAMRNKR